MEPGKVAAKTRKRAAWHSLTPTQKQAKLRSQAPASELRLQQMLDSHPATAGRYEHQASVCGYFPDFCFPHARVIVELDGACHVGKVARRRDALRTARLRKKGWRVIRFWNSELRSPKVVMKVIVSAIRSDS
jgi:very-short-patch-repair endonuclease